MHKIGVPIKSDTKIFINLSVCKLKSKSNKGDKIIIGRHVIIQMDKDLDKKIVSNGTPDI
tara:strand:+ start:330 stop:509 length:180 start_codon:yes stop_codon:yes gene_type:complete